METPARGRGRPQLTERVIQANRERVADAIKSLGHGYSDAASYTLISHVLWSARVKLGSVREAGAERVLYLKRN
jgi:hypothetical protein